MTDSALRAGLRDGVDAPAQVLAVFFGWRATILARAATGAGTLAAEVL